MSRRCRTSLISVLGVFALVTPWAAGADSLEKGTVEFSPSASFSHQSVSFSGSGLGSQTDLLLSFDFGYCATRTLEPTGGVLIAHSSIDPDGGTSASATAFGLSAGLGANFATQGTLVPFVRGALGFLTYSGDGFEGSDTEFLAPILSAGVRTMIGRSASVNFSAMYQHHSTLNGVKDLSANDFGLGVGVSVFTRR